MAGVFTISFRPATPPLPATLSLQARNVALVVAASSFIQLLDGVIIVTALPQMAVAFGVDTLQMSIGVTIYLLASAIAMPPSAWLADRFGARRVFLIAMALFTLASIGCGAAQDLTQFASARFMQGLGGAIMVPLGRIIVLRSARKAEIVRAIGLTVWPALLAPVLGPAIGGFLTAYVSWQWNFWINVPLGLLGLLLTLLVVPSDGKTGAPSFDWLGFVLVGTSLSSLLYGFDSLATGSALQLVSFLLISVGLCAGIGAVVWLRGHGHPLLDLGPLRVATFAAAEAFPGAILRLAINATPFLMPLMFQVGFGLDPLQAAGLVMAYFFGNLLMKIATTAILRRFGFRNILSINGALAGVAIAACGLLAPDTSYPLLIIILVLAGVTRSMQFTALSTLAFANIDNDQRGAATTLSSMFQQIAAVFGIALTIGLLNLALMLRPGAALGLSEFHLAFLAMGAITVAGSLQLLTLHRRAGAEVSGHVAG